ncbi:hypothetical protein [Actinomarinicola tropica]|uniref:Glycosyltransferase RgtA/B/C/D-like domain-containing protein n=1 Tax=Actinomarinicola tropica TaxID=2789776 RepID=A0A5Q2RN30_9ACTN|nr:hypothetical protein [Actinomarinicola tropica]QGG95991.1 hypothetical protein GH723_13280 [Actinomarinicola tropica]
MSRTEVTHEATVAPEQGRTLVEVGAAAALALVPFLWRVAAGTRRLPNDDTWAYERILDTFVATGRIELIDWNDITLLGMLPLARVWTAIVGDGTLQIHLLGSVMGFVVLMALRDLLRTLASRHVLLVMCSVGAFSGFVVTTGTFMSDLFALAGSMVALAAAARLAARPHAASSTALHLAVAIAASAFAFSVRQQAAVAIGVSGLLLLVARSRARWSWLIMGVGFAAIAGPFYLWRAGLEHGGGVIVLFNSRLILASWVLMGLGLCLGLLPMALRRGGTELRGSLTARLVVSVLVAIAAAAGSPTDLVNDYLSIMRWLAELGVVGRVVAAVVLANVVLTVLFGAAARRIDVRDPLQLGLALGAAVALLADVVVIFLSSDFYSRYSLFTLSLLLALWSCSTRAPSTSRPDLRRRQALAWGALAVTGLAALWTLDRAQTPVRVREELADVAACLGVPAEELDAGLVWMGMHTDGIAVSRFRDQPLIEDGLPPTQHHRVFPDVERRAVVLEDEPPPSDAYTVVGPYERSGLLPGNGAMGWLVVRGDVTEDADACIRGSG